MSVGASSDPMTSRMPKMARHRLRACPAAATWDPAPGAGRPWLSRAGPGWMGRLPCDLPCTSHDRMAVMIRMMPTGHLLLSFVEDLLHAHRSPYDDPLQKINYID